MKRTLILLIIVLSLSGIFAQSKGITLLKSVVLPGWGQISIDRDYGYGFLAAEVGIIGSMFYLSSEQKLSKQESYEYAMQFAHIRPSDYDPMYFSHLSRYNSSGFGGGGYNAMIRQKAIESFPDDPQTQQEYIDSHIYSDEMAWNWDSSGDRGTYSKMRIHTQDIKDYAQIATGLLIFNHLVSGIDILRLGNIESSRFSLGLKERQPLLMLDLTF